MAVRTIDWKRRAEAAFAPFSSIDKSWLPESLRRQKGLLDVAALGRTARRMLYASLPQPGPAAFADVVAVPAWAQGDIDSRRRVVLRLGAFACAAPLRLTIRQAERAALRRTIDDDTWRDAVTQREALVRDDLHEPFGQALRAGDIAHFVAAMGMSVLLSAAPQEAHFVERHVCYYFPRKAWDLRRADLACDAARVAQVLQKNPDGR